MFSRKTLVIASLGLLWLVPKTSAVIAGPTIVDVVADDYEFDQNSEPSIMVNPANPSQVFITAFAGNSYIYAAGNPLSSVYFTGNGGGTWSLFDKIQTEDASMGWGVDPYMAHLTGSIVTELLVRKATAPFNATGDFAVLPAGSYAPKNVPDQPQMMVRNYGGADRIYVTINDLSQPAKTASLEYSLDGGASFKHVVLERVKPTFLQDLPPVRVDLSKSAADGGNTVYAVFQRGLRETGPKHPDTNAKDVVADIVVVKDTQKGDGGFGALGTGGVGVVISPGVITPQGEVGQERLGSDLAIAVSPTDPNKVYVAFAVSAVFDRPTIQVWETTNGGSSWSQRYETRWGAGLPALAVADNGTVALMYTYSIYGNLETHLTQTTDDFSTRSDLILSRFDNSELQLDFDPFIGDFERVIAVGNTFYGTFSASNNTKLFLIQPTFLRNQNLLGNEVSYSVDPYYFSVPANTAPPTLGPGPTAVDDNLTMGAPSSAGDFSLEVTVNDSDPSGDAVSLKTVSTPGHGTATAVGRGTISYVPGPDFTGTDTFTYTIENSVGQTATATVHVTDPFFQYAGAFSGFVQDNPSDSAARGLLTLQLDIDQTATGTLRLGSATYKFVGDFEIDGSAAIVIQTAQGPITLDLALNTSTGVISGSVLIPSAGGYLTSSTTLKLSTGVSTVTPGTYNLGLLHDGANNSATVPHGDGYAIVTVTKNGKLHVAGTLADGTKFSQGVSLADDNSWAFYAPLYGKSGGSVGGAVQFSSGVLSSSAVSWSKLHASSGRFASGFDTQLSVQGGGYAKPPAGTRVFLTGTNGLGAANFGSTTNPSQGGVTANFTLSTSDKMSADSPNANHLTISLNPTTGLYTGKITLVAGTAASPFTGLVVPAANTGFGFCLTKADSAIADLTHR